MKKMLLFGAALSTFTGMINAQIPTLNLQAQYYFTGNANDNSGNGNDGTVHSAVLTQDRFGNTNSAYDFNSPGYIDCNNVLNSTIAGAGKQFTISFWVKPSASNTNNIIIAKESDAGCGADERQFFVRSLNNVVNFEYYGTVTGATGRFVCGSTLMTDTSKWYFVTVQYDGTVNTSNGLDRVKIYVDNVPDATTLSCRSQAGTFPFDIATGNAHFGIGNYLNSSGVPCLTSTHYQGKIDDIRLYSSLLTTSEITSLYNEANVAGIESYTDKIGMNVYPNPAADLIKISLNGLTQKAELRIENSLGALVYSEAVNATESSLEIKTENFAKGIYFVHIIAGSEVLATKKLIIE